MSCSRLAPVALILAPLLLLPACGLREKVEERVSEKIAEKVIEVAAEGGEVEVDIDGEGGKVMIKGKDGSVMHVDGEQGKVEVVDAEGTKTNYEGKDDEVRVTNSEGLDAVASKELPADFPLTMPPVGKIEIAQRVEQPDGSKVFNVNYRSQTNDLEAEAATWQAEFEAKGLSVERTQMSGNGSQMITLKGTGEQLQGSCIISVGDGSGVMVIVTWRDTTAVQAG